MRELPLFLVLIAFFVSSGCVTPFDIEPAKSCAEMYGFICQEGQVCNEYFLEAKDSDYCCSVKCENMPEPSIQETPAPSCTDECDYADQKQCSGYYAESCGDYDSDLCLEWGNTTQCKIGCEGEICKPYSGTCAREQAGEKRCIFFDENQGGPVEWAQECIVRGANQKGAWTNMEECPQGCFEGACEKLPDLVLQSIIIMPDDITGNENYVKFLYSIKNNGDYLPDGIPELELRVVDMLDNEKLIGAASWFFVTTDFLKPGEEKSGFANSISDPSIKLSDGKYRLKAILDYGNTVKEFDEQNNILEIPNETGPTEPTEYCKKIIDNGDNEKNLNVFFVPNLYGENEIEYGKPYALDDFTTNFENDVFRILLNQPNSEFGSGLFEVEPFKSNKNKINGFLVTKGDLYSFEENLILVKENCPFFSIKKDKIVVLNNADFADSAGQEILAAVAGDTMAFIWRTQGVYNYSYISSLFLHEFGHTFGLYDIYGYYLRGSNGIEFMQNNIMRSPNCDVPGCPKWCSGSTENLMHWGCLDYKTESECKAHEETNMCLWLDEVDPYFNSRCIYMWADDRDVGVNCKEGTGCFQGCNGRGFRSNYTGDFVIEVDSQTHENEYEKLSEDYLTDFFKCCYPDSCTNYDSSYCSEFLNKSPRQLYWCGSSCK